MRNRNSLLAYENSFNMTGLSELNTNEYNVLFAVLSKMSDEKTVDELGRISADFALRDIRDILGVDRIHKDRTIKSLDKLLDIKVLMYIDDKFIKANLFDSFLIDNDSNEFTIRLTAEMSSKLLIREKINEKAFVEYTLLDVSDVAQIRSVYSKELYKNLRQYRSTGKFIVNAREFIDYLKIDDSVYSDYKIIKHYLIPSVNDNKRFFKNLDVNFEEGDIKLPNVLIFTFDNDEDDYNSIESEELLAYVAKHGGLLE